MESLRANEDLGLFRNLFSRYFYSCLKDNPINAPEIPPGLEKNGIIKSLAEIANDLDPESNIKNDNTQIDKNLQELVYALVTALCKMFIDLELSTDEDSYLSNEFWFRSKNWPKLKQLIREKYDFILEEIRNGKMLQFDVPSPRLKEEDVMLIRTLKKTSPEEPYYPSSVFEQIRASYQGENFAQAELDQYDIDRYYNPGTFLSYSLNLLKRVYAGDKKPEILATIYLLEVVFGYIDL